MQSCLTLPPLILACPHGRWWQRRIACQGLCSGALVNGVSPLLSSWQKLTLGRSCAQRIEAPVRGGEEAPGSIPDGGPPVSYRKSDLDEEVIAGDGKHSILGTSAS